MDPVVYTDRIVQGADGVYRWKCCLTREQALVHFWLMIKISAIVTTAICVVAFIMFLSGTGGSMTFSSFLFIPLLLYGCCLGLPALIGYLALNYDNRSYDMDEKEIRHKHATKGGDACVEFHKVSFMKVEGNALILKQGITTYTIYAPVEDAAFLISFVRQRLEKV